jgi:DNA repair ATPase RecN
MGGSFSYRDFESSVNAIREKTARFYRVDLHAHTINSYDYPSVHSKPGFVESIPENELKLKSNPIEFKRRFLNRAKEQGLRLVAITDHNESDLAEQLSVMSDHDLSILPGIEITVRASIFPDSEVHIIGIFPEGTSSKQIDKVFPPNCGMPPSGNRGSGAFTGQSISDLISTIHNLHGICIAAHVSSTNGIRTLVHSQNIDWLQKNYLRRYLKEKRDKSGLLKDESSYLDKLEVELKPLDDKVQNAYLLFLANHEFDAIQVQECEHYLFYSGDHVDLLNLTPFPCILSSDSHTLADLGCKGHATHIKMTDVGLSGLRKALVDPGTRIRYDTNVPTAKLKRILGISFSGGSFDRQVIGFSDNLTTLIGGRGTGKSALIESIRFILNQSIESLPDRLKKDIQERLDFTLRDTEVKLLFSGDQDNEIFILKRRLGDSRTSCFTLDGEGLPEIELPFSQLIRAEIFGWNEIEALSDSPRKQLALIDRAISSIDDLKLELKAKREELRINSERIIGLAREIHDLLPHIQGVEEMKRQLENLSSPELNEAFLKFDQNEAGIRDLKELRRKVVDIRTSFLSEGQRREINSEIDKSLIASKENLHIYQWYSELSTYIGDIGTKAQEIYEQLLAQLENGIKRIDDYLEQLEKERVNIETQLNTMAENSGQGDFRTALARRKELTEKLSRIIGIEKEIQDKEEEIEKLFILRNNQIITNIADVQLRIFNARASKAETIAQKLSSLKAADGVNVNIEHLMDREEFSRALGFREGQKYEGLFQRIDKQYLSKDYPGYYALKFSPHEFVHFILGNLSDCTDLAIRYIRKIDNLGGKIVRLVSGEVKEQGKEIIEYNSDGSINSKWPKSEYEFITMEDFEKVWKHLSPLYYDNETNTHLDPSKLKNLLDLELCDIEDLPVILLNEKPIEELSPGQRCSALIPIILVEGSNPLIIDQPEDNLDNKMVFDLVVDILRGLKEYRQIIVATHNPNIPVSGDAEQVVVFESPMKDVCCLIAQGSIDDEIIIKNIKMVMEGGDKAFEIRMKKYGLKRNT